jgi:pimeloyl-ACP methyl ester carboxylesterase
MWEPLLTRLGDAFHLVAPDYPGFGHSDTPDPAGFAYTFDHLAEVIDGFTAKLGLTRYVLFLQDYGGPIGFRLALAHPDRSGRRRVHGRRGATHMTGTENLTRFLNTDPRDVGCDATFALLDVYVERMLQPGDAETRFPGVAVYLRCSPGAEDFAGLLAVAGGGDGRTR